MKTTKIFLLALAAISLVACDKHDFIDDLVITGNVGPQAYWEVGSTMAPAGSSMDFVAQYYTSLKDQGVGIDRSEVWYNISETIDKTVNCPWVSTFAYTVSSIVTAEKRAQQKISEYKHSEVAVYSDSLKAYTFASTFPISGTLSPFQWAKPVNFTKEDSVSVETYFGAGFMQTFKDSLYTLLSTRDTENYSYADFRKMYMGITSAPDFQEFTDSTWNPAKGPKDDPDAYDKHFKWNADSTAKPIPAKIEAWYKDSVTFAQLINSTAENCYDVSYKRTYAIRAIMRVYDDRKLDPEVYGTTVAKDIEIN